VATRRAAPTCGPALVAGGLQYRRGMGATPEHQGPAAIERTRTWRPERRLDLRATLGVLRRGGGDPTWREPGDGQLWKGCQTPDGPGTLALRVDQAAGQVHASAWGPGATWLVEHLPVILGEGDDPSGFAPEPSILSTALRHFPGWRVPRTSMVVEALVPAIIEQRVTGREAFGSYRRLVRRYGQPAPGPGAELDLWVAPDARGWASIPSWEWLRAGVDSARANTIMRALQHRQALDALVGIDPAAARERLASIRGIGVWTAAEVAHRALGDADAVSFGDYHVARNVGWALLGRPIDDTELAEVLTPYAGHRYRVQRLIELTGLRVPRHGPRRSLPTHVPTRW